MKPTLALMTGDPAGIGPELVARLCARPETTARANVLLVSSAAVVEQGQRDAGVTFAVTHGTAESVRGRDFDTPVLLDWRGVDMVPTVRGAVDAANGRFMLDGLAEALALAQADVADAVCFAPLNKAALRAGGMRHPDELHYFCELLEFAGPCIEFNVLDTLWTSRVTSHVPLKDVSSLITREAIVEGIALLTRGLQAAGLAAPRIAVCGLNPHNGDNGAFGREELDVIGPAVEAARAAGWPADGPFPADTAFVRATRGGGQGYDGVLTMYHDQGQIAMKLMGFDRGVTVPGGLPIPIATPAHGTAYDLVGQGRANTGAMENAFALACRMGERRRVRP
ncbi:MAG: 4-hydroxythreonine-4-phosphate dehydrogenase PdxA [Proteobacteria bacterium]|nr:4-hydroxythreonine-4-phosphate dehydrogenase PdxA [Pseudomonadota bacterium]